MNRNKINSENTPTSKPDWFKIPLFYVLLCVLIFLILEIFSRVILGFDPLFYRIRGLDDSSERLSWVRSHHGVKTIFYEFNDYSPSLGWVLKPGLKDVTVFSGKYLNSNSKGLRGTVEFPYAPPEDKIRILLLGDSFTFGDEVSDHETFGEQLKQMIPNSEVINMGVSGYGHDQMLIALKSEGVKYKPDIVIVGFLYYDMERNLLGFRTYAKPRFEITGRGLRLRDSPVPRPETLLKTEFFKSKFFDLLHILRENIRWKTGKNEKQMKFLSEAILSEIVKTSEQIGAVPVLVYFCNESDFTDYFDRSPPREAYFLDYCRRADRHCTSVRPYFLKRIKAGENIDTYGHWDWQGHQIAAQAIKDYLTREKLIPGEPAH